MDQGSSISLSRCKHMEKLHVAAAIIYRSDTIYAAHRSTSAAGAGWEFPGGKLRPQESADHAVQRELREECDCKLATHWLLDTVEYDYPSFHLSMDCFVCTLAAGSSITNLEHDADRWLSQAELLDVDWLPADRKLVRQIGMFWDSIFCTSHL